MTERFDDVLLQEWMRTHYGYGNYAGDYWFIGMEEGCRECNFAEINRRVEIWRKHGKQEIDDVQRFHHELGVTWWFTGKPRLQPTWKGLIRVLLDAQDATLSVDTVRRYQRDRLARSTGETCLLEFLPLPSHSTGNWIYGEHSGLEYLASRDAYREACAKWRAEHIRQRMADHAPKGVVFYSTNSWYRAWWQKIAGVEFAAESDGLSYARAGQTNFVIMMHPTAFGVSKQYLSQASELLHRGEGF